MITLFAKVSPIPVIQASRTTYLGQQYTVADPGYIHMATVNGDSITCSCDESACAHIQLAQDQQARNAHANVLRVAYRELFGLSYGD